jgi:hypothetical protein
MFEAEANKTRNIKLRESFDKIRNIAEFTPQERQLNWLVHLLQLPASSKTKKLVNAWVPHCRRGQGQPQHFLLHSFQKALVAVGETKEDQKQAVLPWKTDIRSATLKEWRVQCEKSLHQGMLKKEKEQEQQRTERRGTLEASENAEALRCQEAEKL